LLPLSRFEHRNDACREHSAVLAAGFTFAELPALGKSGGKPPHSKWPPRSCGVRELAPAFAVEHRSDQRYGD
jgi:hypothetical protein